MIETRTPTDVALPLSVPRALRLHGLLTTQLEKSRKSLALLVTMRCSVGVEDPDLSEEIMSDAIRDYEIMRGDLETLIYPRRD